MTEIGLNINKKNSFEILNGQLGEFNLLEA